MRTWHRRMALFFASFMLLIALSGIALQVEMEYISPARLPAAKPSTAAPEIPLESLVQNVISGVRRMTHGRIADLAIRTTDSPPTAEVMVLDPLPRRIRLNALTGAPLQGADSGLHRALLEFHRGTVLGKAGLWLSIGCGLVLSFFSVSGLKMYIEAYRRRSSAGKKQLLW